MATWNERTQRWVATRTVGGKRLWFYSKTSAEEADRQARQYRPATPTPIFDEGTFAQFVYGPWKANAWDNLKPMSRVKYNGILKHHVLPILGHLRIAEIGLEDMHRLRDSMTLKGEKNPGGKVSNRLAAYALTLVLSIMKLARRMGKTRREDYALVKMPRFQKKKERVELPEETTKALLTAAEGDWMAGPLFCALFLGLRRGEVCGLKWNALDKKKGTIRIAVQRQRQPGLGTLDAPTKGEARTLYATPELIEAIERLGDRNSVYVFTGAQGFPMRPDRITHGMNRMCKLANLPKITFHDLRSEAATNLSELGVPEYTIAAILGHKNLDVTQLYIRQRKEQVRDALGRLLTERATG